MSKKTIITRQHVMSPEKRYAVVPLVELLNGAFLASAHQINTDSSKIVMGNKSLSHKQVVVAAGPGSQVNVGDWININVDLFPREKIPTKHDQGQAFKVHPPLEKIGGTDYLFLNDRFIKWVIERATDDKFQNKELPNPANLVKI